MRYVFISIAIFAFSAISNAQSRQKKLTVSLRTSFSLDFQEADITQGPREFQRATTINYGVSALLGTNILSRVTIAAGLGYTRERFGIRRPYNHQALNIGRDSLPIFLKTKSYDYHLLSLPIVVKYFLTPNKTSVGFEVIPAAVFYARYNGEKVFPDASNSLSEFRYFSSAIHFTASIPFFSKGNRAVMMEPYVRIFHQYHKDNILYEDAAETITRSFDAIGVSLVFQLNHH